MSFRQRTRERDFLLPLQPASECSFSLVVRELELIIGRFFIVDITSVAAFDSLDSVHEDESASGRNTVNCLPHLYSLRQQRILAVKLYLIEGLRSWPKGFVYLSEINSTQFKESERNART